MRKDLRRTKKCHDHRRTLKIKVMTTQEYFDTEKLKLPIRAQQALAAINASCAELLQMDSFSNYSKYGSKSLDAIQDFLNQIRSLLLEGTFDDTNEYIGADSVNGKRKLYYEIHKSDLSARAQAILIDLPLSFPQIMELTRRDIYIFKNCGEKTAKEILSFIDSIKECFPQVEKLDDKSNEDKKSGDITFEELLLTTPARALHVIKNYKISNKKELAKFLYEFPKVRNFGEKTRAELVTFYENLVCDELKEKTNESRMVEFVHTYNASFSVALDYALEAIYTRILYLIETEKRQLIRTYYQSHTDVLQLDIEKELEKNDVPIESQLRKSLYAFRDLFLEIAEEVIFMPIDEWIIHDDFEYLSERERLFVLNYKESHKHFPLYFLMQEAIRHVYINNDYSYEILAGIFNIKDATKKTVDRKPSTYERKQKFNSLYDALRTKYASLVTNDVYPNIRKNLYLSLVNTNFEQLQKNERLVFDFAAFCFLSSVLFPEIKLLNLQFYNSTYCEAPICGFQVPSPVYTYAVNQLLGRYKFAETIADIWMLCSKKRILENVEINLYPKYLLNVEMWEHATIEYHNVNQVLEVLQLMLSEILGDIKIKNGILYVRANSIDKKRFLYEYIATQERPVSISEVMQVFNARYPEWAFENAQQVRSYLSDKTLFKPIGKTSLYVLKGSVVFTGNIMEAIRQVMYSLGVPSKIETVINQVLELRPDSNRKSIRTNITHMLKNGELGIQEDNLLFIKSQ